MGSDMEISAAGEDDGLASGNWEDVGKALSSPPSRERETWILVSLVSREMTASRRAKGPEEPMLSVHKTLAAGLVLNEIRNVLRSHHRRKFAVCSSVEAN